MPIPHREDLAVDRELSPWLVGTVSGGEAGGRAAQFKSSDSAQTGNEYTRLARLSSRRDVANSDNKLWSLYGAQRSQPVATGGKCDGSKNREIKPKPLPWVATKLPELFHGKEGVDGSSPSEGLFKSPANGHFVLPAEARLRVFAGTRRVHFGTSGHARANATSRGTVWDVVASLDRGH